MVRSLAVAKLVFLGDQDQFDSRRYNFYYAALTFVIKSQGKDRLKYLKFISIGMRAYRNMILMGMNG